MQEESLFSPFIINIKRKCMEGKTEIRDFARDDSNRFHCSADLLVKLHSTNTCKIEKS